MSLVNLSIISFGHLRIGPLLLLPCLDDFALLYLDDLLAKALRANLLLFDIKMTRRAISPVMALGQRGTSQVAE